MHHIHYTNEFNEKISLDPQRRELIYNKLEDLKSIDKPENLNSVDSYSGILVLKFHKTNTCRVVIQPVWIEELGERIHVLFVRDYISKKSFDYLWGNITHPQITSGEWLNIHPLPKEEIEIFKRKYVEIQVNNIHFRPPLPSALAKWLGEFKIDLKFDVYEREMWVLYSNDKHAKDGLLEKYIVLFKDLLKTVLNSEINPSINIKKIDDQKDLFTAIWAPFNIGIIYNDFLVDGRRTIVLHNGAHIKEQSQRWITAVESALGEVSFIRPDLLQISKDCFRAYPKWIVTNDSEELWNAIQRYNGSYNLSLLPEQVVFLNSFKFPAYINGQAGSGKSTMLYYLFANVYFYKCLDELEGDLIFLTENDHLLEHTSKSVLGLLSNNPEFSIGLSIEQRNNVRKYFSSFKNYLLNIVPEEEKAKFNPEQYLDFPKFKDLFNSAINLSKKYSAEEVWFVLSTYVFGFSEDQIIDSVEKYLDDAAGVPAKFRIVESSNFKEIISNYLNYYKKLLADGRWDKNSLVRLIRQYYPTSLPKQYSVVFCDEAQDFSNIELKLIIQSSIFTTYDLSHIDQIPVVLAGDALQTVSPTGFSDTRLHQMYFDAFEQANFKYDKLRSTYNPQFNYRSLQPIVRLANVIQNFRKVALQEENSIKQKAKRVDYTGKIPILHDKEWLSKDPIKQQFIQKFKYKSFIIPVDLNEDTVYIEKEEILHEFADVKSSIDAKGAEYSQVVVYGFGDYFLKEFIQLSWNPGDSDFKKRFFFNKLYVAITRAQNELVIIDSNEAIKLFWTPLLTIPVGIDKWEEFEDINELIPISPETGLSNIEDSSPDDALANASLDMEQGITENNIARLIVASNVFLMLGKIEEANNCMAHKEKIKGNWIKAGEHFIKALKYDDAADAFFNAKAWSKLPTVTNVLKGNKQQARLLLAKLMDEKVWNNEEINKVYEIRNLLSPILNNVGWNTELTCTIAGFSKTIVSSENKRTMAFILESIVKEVNTELWEVIGRLYYDTKQFNNAIIAWDRVIYESSSPNYFPEYIKANIEKSRDDQNPIEELLWLGRLLGSDIPQAEQIKISKLYKNSFQENSAQIELNQLRFELTYHMFHAILNLGEFGEIDFYATFVEQNAISDEQLSNFYSDLIKSNADESISIFLKERWAKFKWKFLEKKYKDSTEILAELNRQFLEFNFPFPDSNYAWTVSEVMGLSDFPISISAQPEDHLQSITIKNFRKFEHLSLPNIGQINLIVGNNNSGKTSLLEALLFSPDPDVCLRNWLYARHQRSNNAKKEKDYYVIRNLKSVSSTEELEIIVRNGRRVWSYVVRNPTQREIINKYEGMNDADLRFYLAVKEKTKKEEVSQKIDVIAFDLNEPEVLKRIPFVPFGKGYSEKISSIYYSEINTKKLREDFKECMRVFIPNLIDITIDPETEAIIIEEGNGAIFSLHDYGEGANKLFRILVQLHSCKNKRLMIDEIDAGVHYSNFDIFWQAILKTSLQYNVQIFVTTHNEECIQYFVKALNSIENTELINRSRIITLEQHLVKNEIVPLIRDYSSIEYALSNKIELRGRQL